MNENPEAQMVRAKFKCSGITLNPDGSGIAELYAVHSGSAENDKFFYLTPSGTLTLGTINIAAMKEFGKDKEYYIDITEA